MSSSRILNVGRRFLQQSRKYGGGKDHHFVEPHMNELPIPAGSWQEHYNSKQKGYNAALGAGVVIATGTILALTQSGLIYYNFSPPDHYE